MSDHFLSRWSRRKQEAAKGLPLQEPEPLEARTTAVAVQEVTVATPVACAVPEPTAPAVPLPTLEDAQALTPRSEFGAYMQQGVPAEVRNLAVKKLFADPHFNVMDGLDIYIGDYNTPDPLPAGMLQKMVSAQFMNLVPPESSEPHMAEGALPHENPDLCKQGEETAQLVAKSAPPHATTAVPDLPLSEHDDPDLQLQPNHSLTSPDPGPSAG
ncbi:DUF3306 domain-containing protein [Limnohabitans sp. Jir72]|uniref:DUF3306 domain-containing protein n=1 Tax=Limnohabitans sp. Jir72 TaxID=1977909 RepID=UPI000D38F947|nr:DUF3306 domain-containing protein [Limnohabitans sp. Jir72]PUE34255.1 hypothetical protein B9Z52_04890 [Limnohabitans sp. Jir72]